MATSNLDRASGFFGGLLNTPTERGRSLLGLSTSTPMPKAELIALGETLLSRRGEATGVALASSLLAGYAAASEENKLAFLTALADMFGPDMQQLTKALDAVRASNSSPDSVNELLKAAEPRRQELIRRLNLAPGGTPLAAYYFLEIKNSRGQPIDSVARFHLGNGARLERLNFLGDRSTNSMRQSHGLMVDYLYALGEIESNHDASAEKGGLHRHRRFAGFSPRVHS